MKQKLIIALVILTVLICCIPYFFRYRFGYFEKGGTTNFPHYKSSDIVKLDDGNLLLIGDNTYYDDQNNNLSTPFEIYFSDANKFEEIKFDIGNLLYYPKGILLNDNKLLLTYVSQPPNMRYDLMAIVDLKTRKLEKVFKKKINIQRRPQVSSYPLYQEQFLKLDNGKVFIINFANPKTIIEIYSPKTNSSKLLNVDINKGFGSKIIEAGKDKVLIFGPDRNDTKSISTDVLEYDDATETIKVVGKILNGKDIELTKLNDNEILIYGKDFEIYNIKNNSSKLVGTERFKKHRKFDNLAGKWTYSLIPVNEKYILITGGTVGDGSLTFYRKSTEILDTETGKFYVAPDMHSKRGMHKIIKLNDGKFFVIDSGNKDHGLNYEIFRPKDK